MNVLILFSSSEIGGAERSLSRMAVASNKVHYTLATLEGEGAWSEWVRSIGAEPLLFGRDSPGLRVSAFIKLLWFIRRSKVDVVYICGVRAAFFLRWMLLFFPKVKLIHGIRWNPGSGSRLDRFFRITEKMFRWTVDVWITNSIAAKKTLIEKCNIPSKCISVIYNGVNPQETTPGLLADRQLEVLTVANLNPRKGYIEYLAVIERVVKSIPNARFLFIGRDDMNGILQKAISEKNLDQSIEYLGYCDDVSKWYRRARLFVLPSLWGEGCPTTILEALSQRVPVVAYDIDGVPELVEHDVTGILVPAHDSSEMSEAIIRLLTNLPLSEQLGEAGVQKIDSDYSICSTVIKHEKVFNSLYKKMNKNSNKA